MTAAVGKRALVLLFVVLGFWVCFSSYKAMATRIFPANSKGRDNIIGRRPAPPHVPTPAVNFDDSKRRVPSCPDPLHNR